MQAGPRLWTIPAAGPADAGAVGVTESSGRDFFPAWSGDGRFLHFSSLRGGTMNLWRVPLDPRSGRAIGPPESMIVPALFAEAPTLSRNGKRLAYETWSGRSTLRRLPFDARGGRASGAAEELWSSSQDLSDPRLSSDGKWIAFYRTAAGQEGIAISRIDGTGLRQLTESDGVNRYPRFSPDGQRVAFFSSRSGSPQIWEIHADGSGLVQLSDFKDNGMYIPIYSPDGARLGYTDCHPVD